MLFLSKIALEEFAFARFVNAASRIKGIDPDAVVIESELGFEWRVDPVWILWLAYRQVRGGLAMRAFKFELGRQLEFEVSRQFEKLAHE